MFIACCDSRVDPAAIFDAGPGELFVIRNVANLVPPWAPDGRHHGTSAAIEFAVRHLKVREIVVMGHAQCGGAAALLNRFHEQPGASDFIGSWISLAEEAKQRMLARQIGDGDSQRELEYEIVRLSLANLMGSHHRGSGGIARQRGKVCLFNPFQPGEQLIRRLKPLSHILGQKPVDQRLVSAHGFR